MPAASSSPIDPAIGQLLATAQLLDPDRARLLPVLGAVPDPRARRGVRHQLAVILGLAVCAVLTGARSFTAIAEWAADADQETRDALGITGVVPCESTFRRTLQHLDADALDAAAGSWAQRRTALAPGRRMIAVDGKTLRGSVFCGDRRRGRGVVGILWGRPRGRPAASAEPRACPAAHIVDAGAAMPEQTTGSTDAEPALRSLADKVNWLTDRAPGRPRLLEQTPRWRA
jgi:hypothetical protein